MKKTMLTYETLDRFEKEYEMSIYNENDIIRIEYAAYVANMNKNAHMEWTEADIFNDFLRVLDIDKIKYEKREAEAMTKEKAINAILEYFKENDDEFINVIEELDSYNGYLSDDRIYDMEMLGEFYSGQDPTEILFRAFYGHDAETWTTDSHGEKEYGQFNPNRNHFYYNGYGNLVSCDYKDYSDKLDTYFVEAVIDNFGSLDLPIEVMEIIDSIEG